MEDLHQTTAENCEVMVDHEVFKLIDSCRGKDQTWNQALREILAIDSDEALIERARTHESRYRTPILLALLENHGRASIEMIYRGVEKRMADVLKPIDWQRLKEGEVRWSNTVRQAARGMRKEGLLEGSEADGVWELSAKGHAMAEDLRRISVP